MDGHVLPNVRTSSWNTMPKMSVFSILFLHIWYVVSVKRNQSWRFYCYYFFQKKKAFSASKGKIVKCEKPSTRNICLSFRDPFVKEEKSLKPDCRLFFLPKKANHFGLTSKIGRWLHCSKHWRIRDQYRHRQENANYF